MWVRYLAVFLGLLILSTSLAYGGQAGELVLDRGDGDSIYPGRSFFLSLLEAEIEGTEPPDSGEEALIYRYRLDGLSTNMATPDVSMLVHRDRRPNNSVAGRFNRYLRGEAVHSGLARFLGNRKDLGVLPDRAKPAQVYILNTNMGLAFQHFDGTMSMKETSVAKFEDALSVGTEWDTDHAFVNYVMHPVTGAISYQSAREANWNPWESFLFNMVTCLAWEFLQEPWYGLVPSNQDLIATGLIGPILGELGYIGKQSIDSHVRNKPTRLVLSVLVYPGGMINRGWDKVLGLWCFVTENPTL
jgi:hypothetical protein